MRLSRWWLLPCEIEPNGDAPPPGICHAIQLDQAVQVVFSIEVEVVFAVEVEGLFTICTIEVAFAGEDEVEVVFAVEVEVVEVVEVVFAVEIEVVEVVFEVEVVFAVRVSSVTLATETEGAGVFGIEKSFA